MNYNCHNEAVLNAGRFAHWILRILTTFSMYLGLLLEQAAAQIAHQGKSCSTGDLPWKTGEQQCKQ